MVCSTLGVLVSTPANILQPRDIGESAPISLLAEYSTSPALVWQVAGWAAGSTSSPEGRLGFSALLSLGSAGMLVGGLSTSRVFVACGVGRV